MTTGHPVLKRIAVFVRRRRKEQGWSQKNLAERCGLSRDTIRRLEAGHHDSWSSVVLGSVLPELGVDLTRILKGTV